LEIVEVIKAVPADSLSLGLSFYVIYKLIEWWRVDLKAVNETLATLIATVTRLTVMMEIQKKYPHHKPEKTDEP
jgi:hypothetical protein